MFKEWLGIREQLTPECCHHSDAESCYCDVGMSEPCLRNSKAAAEAD